MTKKVKKLSKKAQVERDARPPVESKKPSEPEVIILERTVPEVKKSPRGGVAQKNEGREDTATEPVIEVIPNKTEHSRTGGRKVAWGILVSLVVGLGLSTGWLMSQRDEHHHDDAAQVQEPELTPEEQAAEEERRMQEELAEQERRRQEEVAEAERRRQEELALEKEQRAERIATATAEGKPLVALTFDDGPGGATTPRLLDILKEKGVKATFFVLGGPLSARPDIVQRAEVEGHEVESHTMTHVNLEKATVETIQWEAASMRQLFQEKLGHEPSLTRPPYGNGIRRAEVINNIGTPLIYWSVDTEDWKSRNAAAVQERVRQDTYDGAIILMHDIYQSTVDAVPGAIDELRSRGYEFVTVKELAAARGVKMVNGVTYFNFRP